MELNRVVVYCLLIVNYVYGRIDRVFRIKPHLWSEQVLDIANLNPCADAEIIVCPVSDRSSQYWEMYNNTIIRNVFSGYVLDVKKGKDIILWPATGSTTQQWLTTSDVGTKIKNWGGRCLSVSGKQDVPGTKVVLENCQNDVENKLFDIVYREPTQ
ncbi:hypothetical protein CHUAL_007553 [Chamberlinius hualienensis]